MNDSRKGRKWITAVFLVALLCLSSGCALFLVGAGVGGGYMIRKGEEGESSHKKESSQLEEKSPSTEKLEYLVAYAPTAGVLENVAMGRGDTQ